MRNYLRILLCLALWLPVAAFAQTTNTTNYSNSSSSSVGATNAVYDFVTTTVGPATAFIDDRGVCTLQGPPFPNCTLGGGTGTAADPFQYACSGNTGPPITGCTSGTAFVLAGGQIDIDLDTHTETIGSASVAAPIPLDPWVPIGSALGVALLAMAWQLRRRRH